MITLKELKATNTRESLQNMVRKSWSLQLSESDKAKMKALPKEARFALYNSLDKETSAKHIELMVKHYEDSIAKGAKTIIVDGNKVLEKSYQIDTDLLLIEAGQIIANTWNK